MYHFFLNFSRVMAFLGGLVLSSVILLTFISILGRNVGSFHWIIDWIVNGSFEVSGLTMAFVIFSFFPITQITAGHAVVDIFTSSLNPKTNRMLILIAEVLMALILTVVAVQLFQGMMRKFSAGETTLFLRFPLWWGYGFALVGAAAAAIVSIYVAVVRLQEFQTGQSILPTEGADH